MASTLARLVVTLSLATGVLARFEFAAQTPNPPAGAEGLADKEELIAEKASSCPAFDDEDTASADGRKIAWRCRTNDKWTVLVNGVPQGGPFEEVRWLVFSPDGRHLAFAARRDKRWMIVEDGTERPGTYAEVGLPRYSADSKRMAFSAKPTKKWVFVVDGEAQSAEFDSIATGTFSPDGKRLAYVGRRGDKYFVVVDGKEAAPFDIVSGIEFSSDSRRFAYAGADVKRGFGNQKALGRATIDGVAGPVFEGAQVGSLLQSTLGGSITSLITGYVPRFSAQTHGVTAPVFSHDGLQVTYAARREKDATVLMVAGKEGPPFPSIVAGPVFSPDNRNVAFAISKDVAITLVINGDNVGRSPARGTDFISELRFGPDNQRVGYVGVTGGNMYEQGQTARARRRVYIDGAGGQEYDVPYLGRLQFSPDGQHVMYVVGGLEERGRKVTFVVVNTREGKRYDDIFLPPRFEDDGRAISYTAHSGSKFYFVTASIGGTPSPTRTSRALRTLELMRDNQW